MSKPLPTIILGKKLRQLREQAGITQKAAARSARFSYSKLSLIENGMVGISLFDVAGLCRLYNAPRDLTGELERMSDEANSAGWWESYMTYMLADFAMFLELEDMCSSIRVFEPDLVTGLLQTEDYARRVNAASGVLTSDQIDQAVALLMQRQDRFWARSPRPDVRIVISEAALLRPEVDDAQRQRILDRAGDGSKIGILRLSDGAHPSMRGPYTIFSSSIPEISDTLYTETVTGARYEPDVEIVDSCRTVFDATDRRSIPVKEYSNEAWNLAEVQP